MDQSIENSKKFISKRTLKKENISLQTELTKAQAELLMLDQYRKLLPIASYLRDMEFNIVFWSESMEKLMGYKSEEVLGKKCYEVFKSKYCDPDLCPVHKAAYTGEHGTDVPLVLYDKKGEALPTLCSYNALYNEAGEPELIFEITKDQRETLKMVQEVQASCESLSAVSEELVASTQEVNALTQEVYSASEDSVNNTKSCFKLSDEAVEKGKGCIEVTGEFSNEFTKVMENVRSAEEKMNKLQESSERITDVINIIKGIADQTNLLALNASIEAARAGEVGKGFAVVANEIRTLSEQTNESVNHISENIESIIKEINVTSKDVSAIGQMVESVEKDAENIAGEINEINGNIADINTEIGKIEENSNNNLSTMNAQTEDVKEISRVSEVVAENANQLIDIVSVLNPFDEQ